MAVSECETVGIATGLPLGLVACGVGDSSAPQRERALLRKRRCPLAGNTWSDEE